MTRKKTKKRKKTSGFGGFFSKKKKRQKRKNSPSFMTGLKVTLTIVFLTTLIAGGAVGLIYMDAYVKTDAITKDPEGTVIIKAPAIWLDNNAEWNAWIEDILGGATFPLNKASARDISQKLESVAWFKNFRVQTKPGCIEVEAIYRQPVGLIETRDEKVYVGDDMVVMNYIPITTVPVIKIDGASSKPPESGRQWQAADAEAAVELLSWLYRMDLHFQQEKMKIDNDTAVPTTKKIPGKPLLDEIEGIDVSNFAARKSRSKPNIILRVKDGTIVRWGAAWGQANVYFEADEKKKLNRLYEYFVDHGNTLQGTARNIDLCWLEDEIPRPR
ncbi:MAG: hypothetical protein ACYSO1_00700 [Planctomycetota bacterium]|jgi:hypothetical protein